MTKTKILIFYKYTPDEGKVFWFNNACSNSIFTMNGNLDLEEITEEEAERRLAAQQEEYEKEDGEDSGSDDNSETEGEE